MAKEHPLVEDAKKYEEWAKETDDKEWAKYLNDRAKECRWLVKAGTGQSKDRG